MVATPSRRGRRGKRSSSSSTYILVVLAVCLALSFPLVVLLNGNILQDMPQQLLVDSSFFYTGGRKSDCALEAFDLSTNHLQRISLAGGAVPVQVAGAPEDFLPIVSAGSKPDLRFRLRGQVGAPSSALKHVSAYQIQAEHAHADGKVLWDSGKVFVSKTPRSIEWNGNDLKAGTVVKWRVLVWDASGGGPGTSEWTKFGVGPQEFTGQWITHPDDSKAFKDIAHSFKGIIAQKFCEAWKARRPLPIARAKVELSSAEKEKKVTSALLVMSGLGSFSASINGKQLSSSSPLDPAMMDYTKRVTYRGFDVTDHFNSQKDNVVGVTLGSGWWDGRPLVGGIVKFQLLPRGPLTTIAELHLTFSDGSSTVKIPSGEKDWQVAKGFVRDSDLFTGDTMDMGVYEKMRDWNTASGYSASDSKWTAPALFKSDINHEEWRERLHNQSGAKKSSKEFPDFAISPLGRLVPVEAPPVMPIERLAPESVVNLGDGRWLYDFGKAFSGVLRFESGLPSPIKPETYPRAHSVDDAEKFITVVYGESLQMETGDINLLLVAGMGLHDGGIRKVARGPNHDTQKHAGPCFPHDHEQVLTERDVFVGDDLKNARQAMFTSHGFRFAEVCCTKDPPKDVYALAYRTAFQEWGKFDSSHVLLNGAYELTRNALNSNMLGTQTDCPHRERLQYGGDLNADSPAALHFFDLSGFYGKIIHDWIDTQWDNGAYTETSVWQSLNEYAAIGYGAGETAWASAPPVLTVRHAQHYGDTKFMKDTFNHHLKWLEFLNANWWDGMRKLNFNGITDDLSNFDNYKGNSGGLGDWLSLHTRDVWLTHHAFYMASARSLAYLAEKLRGGKEIETAGAAALAIADKIKTNLTDIYVKKHEEKFWVGPTGMDWSTQADLAMFSRIVPGSKRCGILKEWLRDAGSGQDKFWPGDEEKRFFRHLNKPDLDKMIERNKARHMGKTDTGEEIYYFVRQHRHNTPEGIFGIRYALRTLSDMGFHNIALSKVTGTGVPSFEYMMSHNGTTMWEAFWRSEDVYSRNHPMLGAVAEWLTSSVAGVALAPTTMGGEELLFWPRIPTNGRVVRYASATQGTKRGDASIAWKFLDFPKDKSERDTAVVKVQIRIVVPPASKAILRLPQYGTRYKECSIKYATVLPDLETAKANADKVCLKRRKAGKGFKYNWEYDRKKEEWNKFFNGKAIGTPCESHLFSENLETTIWSPPEQVTSDSNGGKRELEVELNPGFYDVILDEWRFEAEIEDIPGYSDYKGDIGPHCSDPSTYHWDVNDATHMV